MYYVYVHSYSVAFEYNKHTRHLFKKTKISWKTVMFSHRVFILWWRVTFQLNFFLKEKKASWRFPSFLPDYKISTIIRVVDCAFYRDVCMYKRHIIWTDLHFYDALLIVIARSIWAFKGHNNNITLKKQLLHCTSREMTGHIKIK